MKTPALSDHYWPVAAFLLLTPATLAGWCGIRKQRLYVFRNRLAQIAWARLFWERNETKVAHLFADVPRRCGKRPAAHAA